MNKKIPFTRGTLGLVLAASVFLGCQDFLGEEKAGQAAPPSDASGRHVAQVETSPDAQDMPAQSEVETEPVKTSPPPASTSLTPEQQVCLDLYNLLQSGTGNASYSQAKNQYGEQNCDVVLGDAKPAPPPYIPPTLEERCRMYRLNLTQTPPTGDPKYQAYMAEMAIMCVDYP